MTASAIDLDRLLNLPERSFRYLLHAMRDEHLSPGKLVSAPHWRLFLMHPADVEHELLRVHPFRKLARIR